jgi:hypothetical protein
MQVSTRGAHTGRIPGGITLRGPWGGIPLGITLGITLGYPGGDPWGDSLSAFKRGSENIQLAQLKTRMARGWPRMTPR